MNYTIEEKLKEIPIACVRERALECWSGLNEEQKQEIELCFLNSLGCLSNAVELIKYNNPKNEVFWEYYESYLEHQDEDELHMFVYAALWRFQCETIFKSATPDEQLLKLQEEIEEIKQELDAENVDKAKLGTEIADGIIVLLSLAQSAGISTEDILFSYLPNKIFKNVNRNWVKLEDGTFKHVKE